ncbi:hypothetical protein BIW11_12773 [Tropilaelaps mercedesae]|uniref:Transmembrane protein n=1 Tax=Tropilaelaps mercedesae TaxID=418985 RepID=A0A1V9X5F9_9ACAR|nr:hypothetical protein BIW11_12773 [Tropilaelaps mercedesae]
MMLSKRAAQGRWTACFSLAVFQTIVGIAVGSLAVAQLVLASLVQSGHTPQVNACHDSTIAAVLQAHVPSNSSQFRLTGVTLITAGSLGVWAYAPFLSPSPPTFTTGDVLASARHPKLVLVASHVLFSAVVAFVGYNAAASHGCFALGKGGEKAIFGIVVARVVLSYLCHIVGGLCAGLAMPDLCRAILIGRQHGTSQACPGPEEPTSTLQSSNVQRVIGRMNSQMAIVTREDPCELQTEKSNFQKQQQFLTVITLPDMGDGSTIYAVPADQFVVQKPDGSVCIPGATAPTAVTLTTTSAHDAHFKEIPEEGQVELTMATCAEDVHLVS